MDSLTPMRTGQVWNSLYLIAADDDDVEAVIIGIRDREYCGISWPHHVARRMSHCVVTWHF
jgi:hypothetical protein